MSTSVAFVWSDFKSDEAFLEHMKKTMAENGDQPLKHVRVAYDNKQRDPNNRLPNDAAAAWLKYLDENVIAEHAATIETLAFDIEFSVNLMGYPSYPGCFRFAVGGGAAFKAFNHLMGTMRKLSQRENVDVTICGIKRRDMQFVVVDEITNPSPPTPDQPTKPKPATTQVYGHRLNAKTGQIEAVMGVSDDAKWTHFETATTESEYVVSMGELPENVPIQVVVDADGKSVCIKNEDYDYMDPTKRPTTWVGRTFLVPHDAIASTISAERSPGNNSISVRIKRNADATVPSDLWPISGNGHMRKIPIQVAVDADGKQYIMGKTMKFPPDESEMVRVLDALIAGAKRIHVTGADTDFDQVVGALKYQVMHYYDDADDVNTFKDEISDWESWTPTDPLQAFLKMGVNVFNIQYRGRRF